MHLDQMREAVFRHKPEFERVIATFGAYSLRDYFAQLGTHYQPTYVPSDRRIELINALTGKTRELFGNDMAIRLGEAVSARYGVSTANHHDTATHPFFAHALIASGYTQAPSGRSVLPILSCAGVSLGNSSFPRGLLIHDSHDQPARLHLVSLKDRHRPVYGHPGYSREALVHVAASIDRLALSIHDKEQLRLLIESSFGGRALEQHALVDQLSVGVHALYKHIPGLATIDVVYLPQEAITLDLLKHHHLAERTILYQILFEPAVREFFLQRFEGITGAFGPGFGTHLFWGLSPSGRVPLRVVGDSLTDGHNWRVQLAPADILAAIEAGTLMPSMSLTFLTIALYYGLNCFGGFSQVQYLTQMKAAYLAMLQRIPDVEAETKIAQAVPTSDLFGELVLATFESGEPATALDIALRPHIYTESYLSDRVRETTVAEAVDRMMPELYLIAVGHDALAMEPSYA